MKPRAPAFRTGLAPQTALTIVAASVASLTSLPARAQSIAAPPPAAAASAPAPAATTPTDVQRIEITAGKRRQLQSEVAGTVTAISGSKLEKLGAQDAEDIFKLSPGVQFSKGNADGALYTIRGVGTNTTSDNVIFGQSPTGIYIEDVPFTDPYIYISSPDLAPFDLQRVEVLRGPQGALYGSSSLGGAVRYLFARPEYKQTRFSLLGGLSQVAGGGNGHTLGAMANLPLGETAALRFVATKRTEPGYVDNLTTGKTDVNEGRSDGARLLFGFKPLTGLEVTAIYATQRGRQDGSASVWPDPDKLQTAAPIDGTVNSKFDLGTLQVNWDVGGLRVTSLTGYQTKRRDQDADISPIFVPDFTLNDIVDANGDVVPFPQVTQALNIERRKSRSFTQELRLAPVVAGDFNWLVGLFHQKVNFRRTQTVYWLDANDPVNLPDDIYFDTLRFGEATENSVFADLEWKATRQWTFGFGGRYFRTQVDFERNVFGGPLTSFESKESGTTPKLSARYEFSPGNAVYATAARGYRYGGINTRGSLPYKSDSLWNYEAGVRLLPAANLNLDLSAFAIDWKDVQVSTADSAGFVIISNVPKARSTGLEATLAWRPSAQWQFSSALAVTSSSIKADFTSATGRPVSSGTKLPGVAKLQASVDATYNFAGPWDTAGSASAVLQHTGSRSAQLDADLDLPSYSTLDLRIGFAGSNWELTAFASNVTNAKGQSSAAVSYATYINPGEVNFREWYRVRPRTVGFSLRYDY